MAGVQRTALSWVFPATPALTPIAIDEAEKPSLTDSTVFKTKEATIIESESKSENSPAVSENAYQEETATPPPSGATHKKKRNKKKKTSSGEKGNAKSSVQWGDVEEIYFTRELAFSSVPNRGAYPLGLGVEVERTKATVDDLFMQQQLLLLERARELHLPMPVPLEASKPTQPAPSKGIPSPPPSPNTKLKRKGAKASDPASSITPLPPSADVVSNLSDGPPSSSSPYMNTLYETRQFDYKLGRNSMFCPMPEDKRILALMTNKLEWDKLTDSSKGGSSFSSKATSTSTPLSPPKHLSDLIKDLKEIQISRESSGNGCSCKPMKVEKLSVSKMKTELVASGQYDLKDVDKLSKADLIAKLRDVVRDCVMCTSNSCSCVMMGLPCSAQSQCGCLRSVSGNERRQRSNTADSIELCIESSDLTNTKDRSFSIDEVRERSNSNVHGEMKKKVPCGNINGFELFDMAVVAQYRRELLSSLPSV